MLQRCSLARWIILPSSSRRSLWGPRKAEGRQTTCTTSPRGTSKRRLLGCSCSGGTIPSWRSHSIPSALRLSGNATPVSEGSAGSFTAAPGVLVYKTGTIGSLGIQSQLTWYDNSGKSTGHLSEITGQVGLRISPDGTQVAVESLGSDLPTVWILNATRGTAAKLSVGGAPSASPAWSPDGAKIALAAQGGGMGSVVSKNAKKTSTSLGDLYMKAADGAGSETMLLRGGGFPTDWSRDGFILLSRLNLSGGTPSPSLFALRVKDGKADGEVTPYLVTPANVNNGVFSPDGHWVAYESDESGKTEIYVSSFPDATRSRTIISAGGGRMPRWSRNGRELFYLSNDNALTAVPITTASSVQPGKLKELFTASGRVLGWDVAPDGRFLLNVAAANPTTGNSPAASPAIVVSNWQTALRQ
jgi:eukaryotic-like serine/threonine-protein kinase